MDNNNAPGTNYFAKLDENVRIAFTTEGQFAREAECLGDPNVVALHPDTYIVGCDMTRRDILTGNNRYTQDGTLANPHWTLNGSGGGITYVVHDTSLTGNGTGPSPLGVASFAVPTNELVINTTDPEIVGKQYQSFANAFAYLVALPTPPDPHNRWAIRFSGTNNENLTIPPYVSIFGDGKYTSILNGSVNFVADGAQQIGNSIYNCSIVNLATNNTGLPHTPVTATTIQAQSYTPYVTFYAFDISPVSGTFDLAIGVHTYGFNWNDPILAIQSTIRVDYPSAVVTNPTTDSYTITFYGEPSPEGLPYGAQLVVTATNVNMVDGGGTPVQIQNGWAAGTQQVQEIDFTSAPQMGQWYLQAVYGSNTYTSSVMNWNDDQATITPIIQQLVADIEFGEGINLGSASVVISGTPLNQNMMISFVNGTVDANKLTLTSNSTLEIYTPINVYFSECSIQGGNNVGNNFLNFSDCYVLTGNFRPASCTFTNCEILPFIGDIVLDKPIINGGSIHADVNFVGNIKWDSPKINNCPISGSNIEWSYTNFSMPEINNCDIKDMGNVGNGFDTISFLLSDCLLEDVPTILNHTKLYTYNCAFLSGTPILASGGQWLNFGAGYDNSISGLASTETQAAIDELVGAINGVANSISTHQITRGSMYATDASILVVIGGTSVYVPITIGLSSGGTYQMTFQNASELVCDTYPGIYEVHYSISVQTSASSRKLKSAIIINANSIQVNTESSNFQPAANQPVTLSGNGFITLAVNDIVRIGVANITAVNDILVKDVTLTLRYIE